MIRATLTYGAKGDLIRHLSKEVVNARAAATAAIKNLFGTIAMADAPTTIRTDLRQFVDPPEGFDIREYRDFIARWTVRPQTPQVKSAIAFCERSIKWLAENGYPEGWMDRLSTHTDASP